MSRPVEIRAYRTEDAQAVTRLVVQLQDYEREVDSRALPGSKVIDWYLEQLLDYTRNHEGQLFVALAEGQVVGYAAVQTRVICEEPDEEDYPYALISDLAVDEPQRGRGVGRALLATCEAFAREKQARWLRIGVLGRNAPAVGLYQSCGFEARSIEMEKTLDQE